MPTAPLRPTDRRARIRPRVVLALGLVSGVVVGLVSLLDFGDPRVGARADAVRDAEARARSIRLSWQRLRSSSDLPPAAVRSTVDLDPDPVIDPGPGPVLEGEPDRLFAVLVQAALAAASEGDAEGALSTLDDAIARADGTGGAPVARALFHATRLAGQLEEPERVLGYRTALMELGVETLVEGTSTRLLATLVPPIDAHAAHALLLQRAVTLPDPLDDVSPTLDLLPDPWWAALRAPLEADAPGLDWDAAFSARARLSAALAARLPVPSAEDSAWAFATRGGATIGHRREGDRWTAATIELDGLVSEIEPDAIAGDGDARALFSGSGLATSRPAGGEIIRREEPLDAIDLAFAVHHPDPTASAAPELRRIRLLRASLLGLSVLVVLASAFAARAMARAARLAELRSTFVASVSHDLRTPTQAILLMAETLEQGRIATPESRERYYTQIRKEAHRLRRLVEDLLDSARIDRGAGARVERREVDTAAFFGELEAAMQERAAAAEAALSITRGALPKTIEVDPDSVHRSVWNLFENALLHGRDGRGRTSVHVTFAAEGGVLECTVHDDGEGVPARHRETVFEAFERLQDRGAHGGIEGDTGTGLGLAIVRALSRAHGGDAYLAPSERGARFVATFPVESEVGDDDPAEGAA